MNKNSVRIPRIRGNTLIAQSIANLDNKDKLYSHILNHYITNGFTYMKRVMSVPELSFYTFIPEDICHNAITISAGNHRNMLNPEAIQDTLRALIFRQTENVLCDRARILGFVEQLGRQMALYAPTGAGDPYISVSFGSLMQKSLETLLKSQKGLQDVLTQMMPKGTTNIFLGNENGDPTAKNEALITRDEALQLISVNANPLHLTGTDEAPELGSSTANRLFLEHHIADTPEVRVNPENDLGIGLSEYLTEPTNVLILDIDEV